MFIVRFGGLSGIQKPSMRTTWTLRDQLEQYRRVLGSSLNVDRPEMS